VKWFTKFVVRLTAVIALLALLAAGYLNQFGFPPFLTKFVVAQLDRAGIAARFDSIRLDLFRGVVATQAVIADAKAPAQPLALIDELELHWNLRRLFRRENPLAAIRIANARISVPTPPDEQGAEQFTATDAFATFRFDDAGVIEIDQLMGVYCGIRLYVTGHLKPRTTPVEAKPKPRATRLQFVTKAVRELNRLRVGVPPQLDLDFSIDLDRPLDAVVTARLRGTGMTYRGLKVDDAAIDVAMRDGAIDVRQFRLVLFEGEVKLTGRYDIGLGGFDLRLDSTTDPFALVTLLAPAQAGALRELRVAENPEITARYVLSAATGSLPQLEAHVQTGALDFRGVAFDSIRVSLVTHGPELKVTDAEILTPEGRLIGHGQFHMESTDFSYEIDSTLDPVKLLPLAWPTARRIIEPAWFDTPPHVVASVTGDFVDPDAFAYDAQLSTERCRYRGVPLRRASATLRLRQQQLDAQNLILVRDEGQLRGSLLADFDRHRVRFDVETTANPTEMAALLGEKAARTMESYRFGSNTVGQARGLIDFDEPTNTTWSATVANDALTLWKFTMDRVRGQLDFTNNVLRIDGSSDGLTWWRLRADGAAATLIVREAAMQMERFDAAFYGGKLNGTGEVLFGNPDGEYDLRFDVRGADVRTLSRAMRTREGRDLTGTLDGKLELLGRGSDLARLEGAGELIVRDGVLWELALYGPLTAILGKTKATDAKATFKIADEFIHTGDLEITTGAFVAKSRGKVGFDGSLDFRVEAQFLRSWPGLNLLGKLLGEIFEYKVYGTLDDPSYRAVNLPKELLPHD
jgi:hypothetical protein